MRTIETTVYSFDELSEEAQQKAIDTLCSVNVDYDWWEYTYEDAETIGLRITSFGLDRDRHAEGEFLLSACEVAQNILNGHGEQCDTFKTAKNFLSEFEPVFASYMDETSADYECSVIEDELQYMEAEFLDSLLEDYSIILQHEYEHLQSNEVIIETIKANDYEFTENGKLI